MQLAQLVGQLGVFLTCSICALGEAQRLEPASVAVELYFTPATQTPSVSASHAGSSASMMRIANSQHVEFSVVHSECTAFCGEFW